MAVLCYSVHCVTLCGLGSNTFSCFRDACKVMREYCLVACVQLFCEVQTWRMYGEHTLLWALELCYDVRELERRPVYMESRESSIEQSSREARDTVIFIRRALEATGRAVFQGESGSCLSRARLHPIKSIKTT